MSPKNHSNKDKMIELEGVPFEEAIKIVGTGKFQIIVSIVGGIVILSSYFANGAITFMLPAAHCDLNMDFEDRGNLASISLVGLILTCHLFGFLSDTLGRRYILIRCLLFDFILYVLTMLAPNFYIIFVLRFLNGVASCGGVVSAYAYVGEFQTDKFRSTALMISSFIAATAYLLIPGIAWLIISQDWQFEMYTGFIIKPWRVYYAVCGIPSLTSVVLLFFLPESPKFLIAAGRKDEVIDILKKMFAMNHRKGNVFTIKSIAYNNEAKVTKLDNNHNKVFALLNLVWQQTVPLLKRPYLMNFTFVCVGLFICYFCNNAFYVWLLEAINRMHIYKNVTGKTVGTFCKVIEIQNSFEQVFDNSISNSSHTICDNSVDPAIYLIYIIFGVAALIVLVIITVIVKHVNKKYLMLFLQIGSLICALSLNWSDTLILMPIKACSLMVFTAAVFPILNSVVVDLFPTNIRAMAGCLTLMASRLGSVVTHEVSGMFIESHCSNVVWNFVILIMISLVAILMLPDLSTKPSQPPPTKTANVAQSKLDNEMI